MPRTKKTDTRAKRPGILTSLTYDSKYYKGEINTLPTETIPDDTISIKELLYRFTNGLPMPRAEGHYYEEIEDVPPHLRQNFDLTDLDDIKDEYLELKSKIDNELARRSKHSSSDSGDSAGTDPEGDGQKELPEAGGSQHGDGEVSE